MATVTIEAHAKVNLGLEVVAKRPDGFHDIDTIFQTVSLSDTVVLDSGTALASVVLTTAGHPVPTDAGNLAVRAADLLRERKGCPAPAIHLTKRTPVGAGLGGGSADAAAVLAGMNELYGLGLALSDLEALALEIGSDVPYLIRGGTSRGRGRGEILDPLPALSGLWFVLVTPPFEVSAAEAYRKTRIRLTGRRGFTRLNCSAIQNGDSEALVRGLRNDLEAGVVLSYPEVGRVRNRLSELGVLVAVMCGSGPTVMGVTTTEEEAARIASELHGREWQVHIAEPIDTGCRIVTKERPSQDARDVQRNPEQI